MDRVFNYALKKVDSLNRFDKAKIDRALASVKAIPPAFKIVSKIDVDAIATVVDVLGRISDEFGDMDDARLTRVSKTSNAWLNYLEEARSSLKNVHGDGAEALFDLGGVFLELAKACDWYIKNREEVETLFSEEFFG